MSAQQTIDKRILRLQRRINRRLTQIETLHRTRWVFIAPLWAVAMKNRWRPWWKLRRNPKTGCVCLTFGGVLLWVNLVLREGKREMLP